MFEEKGKKRDGEGVLRISRSDSSVTDTDKRIRRRVKLTWIHPPLQHHFIDSTCSSVVLRLRRTISATEEESD